MKLNNEHIVCFAGEDYWYHNPHSNLHIMESLAKHNRVLFVNSIGVRIPSLKKDKFAWKRIFKKLASLIRYFRKVDQNFYVFSPIALPPVGDENGIIQRFNRFFLGLQLSMIMTFIGFKNPILWVCVPSFKDIAIKMRKKAKCMVYYCVDNIAHFSGANQDKVAQLDLDVQKAADLSFFVNRQLCEERKSIHPNTHHIGHGVDYEHFSQAQKTDLPIPEDLKQFETPIIGYIGIIKGVDFELVEYLAEQNPSYSFVFVGEIYSETIKGNNIYFLGRRDYKELPQYLAHFDCCCLYYQKSNKFDNYRTPKKLMEYFATGKPIVSVANLEMKHFKDYAYIADTYEEFNTYLKKAVDQDDETFRNNRIRLAQSNTWDGIAAQAAEHIAQII